MSKYTTEVRYICEEAIGREESRGFNGIPQILQFAAPLVFDFDFPIFDEEYRLPLEIKILRHYYTREISEETVGLWKLRLQDRLNMIMPYYNKLYESELLTFNPLIDVDLMTTHEGDKNVEAHKTDDMTLSSDTTTKDDVVTEREYDSQMERESETETVSEGDTTSESWNLYSDTPQGGIQGVIGIDFDPEDPASPEYKYLTNATHDVGKSHSENTDNQTGSITDTHSGVDTDTVDGTREKSTLEDTSRTVDNDIVTTDDYTHHIFGKQAGMTYARLLREFRDTFLNIDRMIIDELSDLFFGLW